MNQFTPKFGVGASVLRQEDESFLRGRGRYTDDIHKDGCLRGFVLRSPVASGSFRIVSLKAAKAAAGVRLVLTAKDIRHLNPLTSWYKLKKPDGTFYPTRDILILCGGEVWHVGDSIAFIVADTLAEAQDAAELVDIDFDSRKAIAEAELVAGIARAAKSPQDVTAIGEFEQDEATYPNGTHICEVEIDPETGATEIQRYSIVDDFGVVVNPILLAGQVHGGMAQGVGQALMENTVYSSDGQLLTASFMDYAMPRADVFPGFAFETRNVPSTTNAMGIKGAGEAAMISSCPAVMNAVIDALWRGHGIRHLEMPASAMRVWQAIQDAKPA